MLSEGEQLSASQKEACAVSAMRTMLEDDADRTGERFSDLLASFCASRTYGALFDYSTRLWAEGPDYLRDFYRKAG